MRVYHAERFTIPLPAGHRFPMDKYRRLRERVENLLPNAPGLRLEHAPAATRRSLERVHDPAYVGRVMSGGLSRAEVRLIGLPWSPALVERSCRSVGATQSAAHAALEEGVAASLAGGTHHAGFARGAGFCVFNDVAVACADAMDSGALRRVLVFDCDVHQGDGNAELLRRRDGVYVASLHAARNYPHHKVPGHCDVGFADGADDATYLEILTTMLKHAIERARPELVFYLAGADVFGGDRLGRLALTKAGVAARDRRVLATLENISVPVALVMAGGYADNLDDIVDIHATTVSLAHASWTRRHLSTEQGGGALA